MPCPFLTRLSPNFVHNYASLLVKTYGSCCPVIEKAFVSTVSSKNENSKNNENERQLCPFLRKNLNVVKEIDNDVVEGDIKSDGVFPYEAHFHREITKKKLDHSYRVFKKVSRLAGPNEFPTALEYSFGEKLITVWCSNDYMGISCHEEVKQAAKEAIEKYGCGAGGTRNISGNSLLHEKLERTLANLHKKEAALLFTSCFVANDSTLYTLAKSLPNCHIFSDANNHASMIQGIRNSKAPKHIYRHNDPNHLEQLLQTIDRGIPKIVAFETVHSMNGSICPLKEICDVAHEYGAITFVDEVHAVGLYGENGAGIGERDKQLYNMDVISGTLGKAFGNIGGYVASDALLIDTVRSYAAGFIFTTSLPPSVLAAANKAIEILSSDQGRLLRERHQENVEYLKKKLQEEGFPLDNTTASHIITLKIGDPHVCRLISDVLLRERGHYIQSINYPTVPRGEEKLRITPTPYHTKEMIDSLINDLNIVWDQLKLMKCKICLKTFSCSNSVKCVTKDCPMVMQNA